MLTDLYYLGMERRFKDIQQAFIDKVRSGNDISEIVYSIPEITKWEQVCNTVKSWNSLSIWPFYLIVIACIVGVKLFF